MSPVRKPTTDSFSPETPKLVLSYMIARTSRWHLDFLFQTFLYDKAAEKILDVKFRRRAISWDLNAIHHLRRCLGAWVEDQVPGDAIGAFLVHILYEQDYHLDYRLTKMVREHQTQLYIAQHVLAFYQIRDEAGNSLWDKVAVHPDDDAAGTDPGTTNELLPRIPAAEAADLRWPSFLDGLNDEELDEITNKLGENGELVDEASVSPLFSGVSEKDMHIMQSFRRFNIHSNDCLDEFPRPYEVIDAMENILQQQNKKLLPIYPSRKPLPTSTTKRSLPRIPVEKPLPHPPVESFRVLLSQTVRVRTFNAEKKSKLRFKQDTKPGMEMNADNVQKKTHPTSSAPRPIAPACLDKALPPTPSDPDFGSGPWNYSNPAPRPALKRKGGVEDLRSAFQKL